MRALCVFMFACVCVCVMEASPQMRCSRVVRKMLVGCVIINEHTAFRKQSVGGLAGLSRVRGVIQHVVLDSQRQFPHHACNALIV